jgi:hypothetical protein
VLSSKWGPPERDKTDGPQGLNDGWVRRPLGVPTEYIDNPVRAGFDQFLVQPHLEFCRDIELNPSQRP